MAPRNEDQTVVETLLKFHGENQSLLQRQIEATDQLRTIVLDFSERLAVNEISMKNADTARLLLFGMLEKVSDKMEGLRDIPKDLRTVQTDLTDLTATVRKHERAFDQFRGGWIVAKFSWFLMAGIVAAVVSFATQWLFKKGP